MTDTSPYKSHLRQIDNKFAKYYDFEDRSMFNFLIMSSFVKALEIAVIINKSVFSDNSFLYLSNLRGTCEELITLKFIKDKIAESDRNILIESILNSQQANDIITQYAFLQKYRPFQPTLNGSKSKRNDEKVKISVVLERNGFKPNSKLPPIEQLASATGISEFYDFMYRASSSFVHFNPRTMMRTVWYDKENVYHFSLSNFNNYYWDFSSFYSVYQLLIIYKEFGTIVDSTKSILEEIDELKNTFKYRTHYPEIVTFEELNLKRPKTKWTVMNSMLKNQLFE